MGLFGRTKPDPKKQVRELQRKLRIEMNSLQRQINAIDRKEQEVIREIKAAAKKGDPDVCKILAKSIVQSRSAKNKFHIACSQINSVMMSMQHQLSTIRIAGTIQQSTEVMKSMQQLMKVPEVMQIMREMSKEMTKMGIIDEIIEETMTSMEPEELEDQAQEEADRILWEVTAGEMGKAPAAPAMVLDKEKEAEAIRQRIADRDQLEH